MIDDSQSVFTCKQYDFELDYIIKLVLQNNYKSIGLQFPEGIKKYALNISKYIKIKTNIKILISSNICFGSCDLDLNILMFVDALFHFGHSPIMSCIPQNLKDKIYFIKLKCNLNINTIIKNINSYLIKDKIGLLSTIQHVNQLNEIREKLQLISNKVFIIKKGDKRIEYPGQIIGCNFSTARKCLEVGCEEFIYVGSGLFHPIGISISTSKNVVCINPYTLSIENVNNRNFFLKRHAIISNLLNSKASKYGILITTKIGQQRIQLANEIYNKIVELKLEAYIIILDLITPEQIRSFDVDAFINTACPRISIDDSNLFHVPLITHYEFKIIIGELEWENLKMDEIIEP